MYLIESPNVDSFNIDKLRAIRVIALHYLDRLMGYTQQSGDNRRSRSKSKSKKRFSRKTKRTDKRKNYRSVQN